MQYRLLVAAKYIFSVIGTVSFCYLALTAADSTLFQVREAQTFNRQVKPHPLSNAGLIEGFAVARLTIPDLGFSSTVLEGVSREDLLKGPGHIPGSALPGEAGNVGIAGHRDTFFRPLRLIKIGQIVILTARSGEVRYRVIFTKVVDPSDTAVLKPAQHDCLTLVTCYPFDFIGPAPKRFIVRAERIP